jgi:hypothetical protein
VEGRIETLPIDGTEPVVLVEAKALFIEPRQDSRAPGRKLAGKKPEISFQLTAACRGSINKALARVSTKWRDWGISEIPEISAFGSCSWFLASYRFFYRVSQFLGVLISTFYMSLTYYLGRTIYCRMYKYVPQFHLQ